MAALDINTNSRLYAKHVLRQRLSKFLSLKALRWRSFCRTPARFRTKRLEENSIEIILDLELSQGHESNGSATDLIAAYESDPEATWLLVACDYPSITADALQDLRSCYKPPVTCFQNQQGFCEPLLGIWSPEAISHVKENYRAGKPSFSKAVRELDGYTYLLEESEALLRNVNVKSEWEDALRSLRDEPTDNFVEEPLEVL
ncbi:hypothetical protein J7337_007997 [Fusarium musae]|uniref:MobA-like NTP transferase domain-containing protein n=1 Tax=Fusarium musae TaxID=1042133 RepID=A0A9P8DCY1_9HYPO|nr:hypothetical protein J7337_007997 [Fusarium musae]KAG9499541.1 hypothetical protein J7337_007997 [Fusarium musae]